MRATSSGIPDLDELLTDLWTGDNVVWVTTGEGAIEAIERSFLLEGLRRGEWCSYVTTERTPANLRSEFGGELRILDARPGRALADPAALEMRILDDARRAGGRVLIDGLDTFVRRLGRARALGLFSRVCPQLYDIGAIAYWRVTRAAADAVLATRASVAGWRNLLGEPARLFWIIRD